MSTPFTTPSGQSWQTLLTELTLAYSERRQAIGQSAYVPEDRIVQSAAYWAGLQNWLESNCISFIDHVNGPLTEDGTAFLYFTLASWRTQARLHADGFRRSPLIGGTAYGQMQEGDEIGPWIFEELQKGFSALRWSVRTLDLGSTVVGGYNPICVHEYPLPEVVYTAPVDQEISLWGGSVDDSFLMDGIDPFLGQYNWAGDMKCNAQHSIEQRDYFLKNAIKGSQIRFQVQNNYHGPCNGYLFLMFRNQFTNA